jgi:hypothetical protein
MDPKKDRDQESELAAQLPTTPDDEVGEDEGDAGEP